jgi:serine/threonine-protein kinase
MPLATKESDARYQIVDEIASGGMGSVFVALRRDNRGVVSPVAIKRLHSHLIDEPGAADAFIDEARIAYQLSHPCVVGVHDVVQIEDELVIVMDWVEGVAMRSLGRRVDDKLPIPVVRRLMIDALEGLHAAHELKDERGMALEIVHRDISPQNLLVGTDGICRVTDFGIALAKGRLAPTTVQGGVKGKLPYLSPEQVNRSKIDRRSDIFAAGVVTWELLTQMRLFQAPSEGETLAMILREHIVPPSSKRMDVPLDLDETVLKALERKADNRYSTALEFARAIEEGGPVASREEVGRIVIATAGTAIAARRQKLALAAERPEASRPLEEEMTMTVAQPATSTKTSRDTSRESGPALSDLLPPPAPSARRGKADPLSVPPPVAASSRRSLLEPPSIPPPMPSSRRPPPVPVSARSARATGETNLTTALPSVPPPIPIVGRGSSTPLVLAIVFALGLAIVVVVKYTGNQPVPPPVKNATSAVSVAVLPPTGPAPTPTPTPAPTPIEAKTDPVSAPTATPTAVVELAPTPVQPAAPVPRPLAHPRQVGPHARRDGGAPKSGDKPFMPDDL